MNTEHIENLKLAEQKMRKAGVSEIAINVFADNYATLAVGTNTTIDENSIEPLTDIQKLEDVTIDNDVAHDALRKTVIIKLNGGLGTSMGLDKAKTLLEVRDGNTFLDIIAKQIEAARTKSDAALPLIFMNSFRTHDDTVEYMKQSYPHFAIDGLPIDFVQDMEPKLRADTLAPVEWPTEPDLEWCPPGHGDIYPSLFADGLLDKLIDAGYEYMHVSNGDNLGATPDQNLAGWFSTSSAPFAMEVCRRTPNDKKGGHLAIRKSDGKIILRELAQTSEEDVAEFQNINKHHYFNTNSLWLNLTELRSILRENDGVPGLPLIINKKTVDPTDSTSPKVIQMESAMGAAIEIFHDAVAIEVPRSRFMPVKTTNDLLLLRSDLFTVDEDFNLETETAELPEVKLADDYYKYIKDFDERFSAIPSLLAVTSLKVNSDVVFSGSEELNGDVEL